MRDLLHFLDISTLDFGLFQVVALLTLYLDIIGCFDDSEKLTE